MKQPIFRELSPYLYAGAIIVIAILALVVFSYLFVAAAVVGAVLYAVAWVASKVVLTSRKRQKKSQPQTSKRKPVIYEHGEY